MRWQRRRRWGCRFGSRRSRASRASASWSERVRTRRLQALYVIATNSVVGPRSAIAETALRERLPTVSELPLMVEAGLLIGHGPDLKALSRRAAGHVDRILKGARPGELPIERPAELELVLTQKTARTIGLTLPPALLRRADRMIE